MNLWATRLSDDSDYDNNIFSSIVYIDYTDKAVGHPVHGKCLYLRSKETIRCVKSRWSYQYRKQGLPAPILREIDRFVASVDSGPFFRRIARKLRGRRLAPRPPTELLALRRFQTSLSLRWFTLIHTRVRETANKIVTRYRSIRANINFTVKYLYLNLTECKEFRRCTKRLNSD